MTMTLGVAEDPPLVPSAGHLDIRSGLLCNRSKSSEATLGRALRKGAASPSTHPGEVREHGVRKCGGVGASGAQV